MKLLLFLTLCMTIVFVAAEPSFVEDEYLEDAEENYARHHLRRVSHQLKMYQSFFSCLMR